MTELNFWKRVAKTSSDQCWNWMGSWCRKSPRHAKYGKITESGKVIKAHRRAYELSFGAIPDSLVVMHKCDNSLCCNPAHLKTGTVAENNLDCVQKNRHAFGERAPTARLKQEQVLEILKSDSSGASLARNYGVSPTTIYAIRVGRSWSAVAAAL